MNQEQKEFWYVMAAIVLGLAIMSYAAWLTGHCFQGNLSP